MAAKLTSDEAVRAAGTFDPEGSRADVRDRARRIANAMSNKALGVWLNGIATTPSQTPRPMRDALLREAANRLSWRDNYAKHEES